MKSLQEWKNATLGHVVKIDDASADCVDISKSWVVYLTGVQWQNSTGWGNAKDIYAYWSDKYLTKLPAGSAPQLGDIAVMDGSVGGGYGHTGVVIAINGNNITLLQGNTFTQQPAYTGVWNAYGGYIKYMRPKTPFTTGLEAVLLPTQRVVGGDGVNHRDEPIRTAHIRQLWGAGEVLDLGGFVRGENVDGNEIWFVGGHTGGYLHSSGFTDMGTHDLPDLTPAKALEPFQRQVAGDVMNYRSAPVLAPDNVIKTFEPGEVLDFKGYVHGASVDGNDIWFVGKYTGGYVHSSGFKDTGTHDLPDLTASPTSPSTPTTPTIDLSDKMVDLSAYDKISDYAACKAAVRCFVLKAGHTGKSYGGLQPLNSDPTFAEKKQNLGEKVVGAYWYGYASLDPEVEAQAFLDTVGSVPATFSYWLDIEEQDGKNIAEVNQWCAKFVDYIEKKIKRRVGYYSNRAFYNSILDKNVIGERPVWLAHFDTPLMSNPVKNQVAHQFTSHGTVPGVSPDCDINAITPAFFVPEPLPEQPKPGDVIVPDKPADPDDPSQPQPVEQPPADPKNIQASVVRTVTPFIVGSIVALLAKQGISGSPEFVANLTAVITFLVGSAYYIVARLLELKFPKAGLLLGSSKKPVYTDAADK